MADTERQVVVERDRGSRTGWIVALVILVAIVLIAIYGLPYIANGGGSTTNVDVNPVPSAASGATGQ